MATVPKPPKALRQNFQSRLGEAPVPTSAPTNLASGTELKDMNFKISPSFHRDFKLEATKRGLKMNEFLQRIYQFYIQRHPED